MKTSNPAVFLDRDGTIADVEGFCCRPEDFTLLPHAAEAIRLLNTHGFKVIVTTNQSGVARGYFSEEILIAIHRKMAFMLAEESAWLDGIYSCPHHPDEGCDCHKPKGGLVLQATKEHDLDLSKSFVVGDTGSDIGMGKVLGLRTIQVGTKVPRPGQEADVMAKDILEAAKLIIKKIVVMIVGARGCGKSEVLKVFANAGFLAVDTEDKYLEYGSLYPNVYIQTKPSLVNRIYMQLGEEILVRCREGNVVYESTGTNSRWEALRQRIAQYHRVIICKIDCPFSIALKRMTIRGWQRNYHSTWEQTVTIASKANGLHYDFILENSGGIEDLKIKAKEIVDAIVGED